MPSLIQFLAVCIFALWAFLSVSTWYSGRMPAQKHAVHVLECIVTGLWFTLVIVAVCAVVVALGYAAAGGMG